MKSFAIVMLFQRGGIVEAVQNKGLTTVEQVKQCTKASGSCGGCSRQ
ncbi:(2Fe-2S)-binding protein [Peribacillus frigoritolerans]|nr:(2Fe-2S)-binding protein [Peribacillus frigoritolerans]